MSEFDSEKFSELLDGTDRLREDVANIRSSGEAFQNEMNAAFDKFKNSISDMPGFKPENLSQITKGEDGHIILRDTSGVDIDITKFRDDVNKGDFKSAFSEININTYSTDAAEFIKELDSQYQSTQAGQFKDTYNSIEEKAVKVDIPEPSSSEDFNKILKDKGVDITEAEKGLADVQEAGKSGDEKAVLDKASQWVDKFGGELKEFIKNNWLKLAFVAALMLAAVGLYDFIKGVQKAMSGCWSTMADQSSTPCKIVPLTCNDEDLNQGDQGFKICQPCQTLSCKGIGGGDWVPLRAAVAKSCDSTGKADMPGCYNYLAPTGSTTCPSPYTDNCTKTINQYACPNTIGCISRPEACSGDLNKGDCSAWCDSSLLMPIPNQTIACKNVSFWAAASAAAGQALSPLFGTLGGFFGQLEKVLLWIAIGIVALVVVYMLGKMILGFFFGQSKEENSSSDHTVKIELVQTPK